MNKSLFIVMCFLLLGLSACSPRARSGTPPTDSSGIQGQVTEGPTCPGPVRIGATECQDRPYQATIQVLNGAGKQVTRFQTDINGNFKIPLSPGTYVLHPESGTPMPRAADQTVEVAQGEYTQVSIVYDTGMR